LKRGKAVGAAAGLVAMFLVAFFIVPLVPYAQPVSIPFNYAPGVSACYPSLGGNTTLSTYSGQDQCFANYLYPPATLDGRSTLGYYFFGLGTAPFPSQALVTQGNETALVFFDGGRGVEAEDLGTTGVMLDPPGIAIENASLGQPEVGLFNFSATVIDNGSVPVYFPSVWTVGLPLPSALYPGANQTAGGLAWMARDLVGACAEVLYPGMACHVSKSYVLAGSVSSLRYTVEVRGMLGTEHFVYRQDFAEAYPQYSLGPSWVAQFMGLVDKQRSGVNLAENKDLDGFAALRFATATSQPDISDYGLDQDFTSYFGTNGTTSAVTELILYPGQLPPSAFVASLQGSSPAHWSALTSGIYTRYGFYVGQAPYEVVKLPCPVTEIPGPGVNITQYFQRQGCSTTIEEVTWLVIILGN
jgi:hypothetical protein